VIQEAVRKGLGEGDISRIEILGDSIENTRENIIQSFTELSKRAEKKKVEN
jgi:hypothetical protein